ncbi:hypothetical protein COA01_29175 [Bacillus cereus]|uniref:hypothetical protein n=1 Tax=Bacillus cereus TaxID=1396 RepID=UPI000BFBA0E9|nr:hypothetical protein [Bacillus cereus]PGP14440.1 hypothetical protein COA01_29175 [Bacillus cereus]
MSRKLNLPELKKITENKIITKYGTTKIKGKFINKDEFLISYGDFQVKIHHNGRNVLGTSIINLDFTNIPRDFHIKKVDVQLKETDISIILDCIDIVIDYWMIRATERDKQGVVFVTKYILPNNLQEAIVARLETSINNMFSLKFNKTLQSTRSDVYKRFMHHFDKALEERILGFYIRLRLKNRIERFLDFLPVLEEIKSSRPLLCLNGEYGLHTREWYRLFNSVLQIYCGSQYFWLNCVKESNVVRSNCVEKSKVITDFRISKEVLDIDSSIKIPIWDMNNKTYNLNTFLTFIDNLIEENKLKNLIMNPHWNFSCFVKQLKRKSINQNINFSDPSIIEQSFNKLVDIFGSWEAADSIPFYLTNLDASEILLESYQGEDKYQINIFRYKYQNYDLNFIFIFSSSKTWVDEFEFIVEPSEENSSRFTSYLSDLKRRVLSD